MGRKILWTALVTAMTSLAYGLAFKGATAIWRKVMKTEPPSQGIAKLLVRAPVRRGILGALHAPSP